MSNGPEITPLASPPTSEPWVPLWPLQPSALGELGYGQITASVTANATSEATATPIVTASPVTVDGQTPIVIEWFLPAPVFGDVPTAHMFLFDGSTSMCSVWRIDASEVKVNTFLGHGVSGRLRLTPTAGTHTYSIRGFVSSGGGIVVYAGTGVGGQWVPCSIRVSLAAPIMPHMAGAALPVSYGTSLPGGPLDGQEAILVDNASAPNWQWRFRYHAASAHGAKWEFIGGAPYVWKDVTEVAVPLSWVSAGPIWTAPLAGIYQITAHFPLTQSGASGGAACSYGLGFSNSGSAVESGVSQNVTATNWMALPPVIWETPMTAGQLAQIWMHGGVSSKQRKLSVVPLRLS